MTGNQWGGRERGIWALDGSKEYGGCPRKGQAEGVEGGREGGREGVTEEGSEGGRERGRADET